ncbi:Fasciclin-like arabinogalactan protein 10 [Raphanus sativus]|uniref:Fasciclin-like arabinogalactan protein 10 n=1 Tax=Raphanus sativus TaxID=3726 RepID=A0A6J0K3J7_RAPSA|nr:fasciclin-like arabinogalactan protein 10 [Raphanus sativus]KAJ4884931.1 Fasciclin-like arabinogalactan protein 10 [Raphanus sativus]
MAASRVFCLLAFTLLAVFFTVSCHNITQILSESPDYSSFNSYLSQTKLSDEINSRTTITVLVLNNDAMSSLAGKHPLSVIKTALSLLVLLDYYDPLKLHKISQGTTLTTTLYQTTGRAAGNAGFVNVTDLKGGKVGFGSAAPGSNLDANYTKSVKQIPYNISILEINAPIIAPGILTAPAPSNNMTGLLEKAGCKTFASMLVSSGVLKTYESTVQKGGLTVFAPSDEGFKSEGAAPDLTKLTQAEVVSLLEYHALAEYKPKGSLKINKDVISTLATNGAGKYDLTTSTSGDEVTLHTGVGPSRVADTVVDETPLVIFKVDKVLLPVELFGKSPSPAPEPVSAPSPTSASTPSPAKSPSPTKKPSPSPTKEPSPVAASPSPPAPPVDESSEGAAPSDSPTSLENSHAKNAAFHVNTPAYFTALVTLAATSLLI